jgi:hypothetical protein
VSATVRANVRVTVPATGILLAYAWWATGLRPFTRPALAAVFAAGALTIVAGRRLPRGDHPSGDGRGVAGWVVLFAVLGLWELAAYVQHPRAQHPTLSSLAGAALDSHPARAAAFVAWVAAGLGLARR